MSRLSAARESIGRRSLLIALLLITVVGALLRLYGIADQPPLRDETLSAFTAEHYVVHGVFGPTMPFHPNLRNLILYASTRWFGSGVLGLRGPSLLMGILGVPLLGLLVLRLTRDRLAALLASFLLAIDPVHITFSRQSIQEVHTAFFSLLGVLLTALAFEDDGRLGRTFYLPLAGTSLGLAVASKHQGLFPMLVCLVVATWLLARRRQWAGAVFTVASLAVLPLALYLSTYLPWFQRGYDLTDWLPMQRALFVEMVTHTGYADSSVVDDRAWQWFLRPLMGYGNFAHSRDQSWVTIAMSNPLTWMLVLPACFVLLRRDRSNRGTLALLLLFWVSYLPLALATRPIWLLSSVAVLPFAFSLGGRFLSLSVPRAERRWLLVYMGLALVIGLLLYPMAVGRALDFEYLRPLVARFNPHP